MKTAGAVRYSPFDYEIHEDPYPTYARLREEAPVYRNDEIGFWALSRHEDVARAFRDSAMFSSALGVSLEPAANGPNAWRSMSFLAMDPPRHGSVRTIISRGFTVRRIHDMEPHILELTREHLEPALAKGSFDFVGDFAGKLPMDVLSEMIGFPPTDRAEVRRLADLLVHREDGVNDVPQTGIEAAIKLAAYFGEMIAARRKSRTEDLISALLDEKLGDPEIMSFLFLIVVAGNETTAKLLANAWYWAWRNPRERAKPFADPGRIENWIDETLRFDGSSQMLARTVTDDVELHGVRIPKDGRALLLIGSANRDPRVFPDPDRYDLDRDTADMVSFGAGRHFCLGAPLARLEARIALTELVRRVKGYDIDESGARRVHSVNVRGFESLPTIVELR